MLKECTIREVDILIERYPQLQPLREPLIQSIQMLVDSFSTGGKLLICGNGGSAADSLHIVGELMKDFRSPRKLPEKLGEELTEMFPEHAAYYLDNLQGALPAISLVSETSLTTAYNNDRAADLSFAQQVLGYGRKGDVLLAISTSGNSTNVLHAARIARALGVKVLSLTGDSGGELRPLSDVLLNVPSRITYQIQELHLPIYHTICLALEVEIFK